MSACCCATAAIVAATCTACGLKSPRFQRETGFVPLVSLRWELLTLDVITLWAVFSILRSYPWNCFVLRNILLFCRMKTIHCACPKSAPGWRRDVTKTTAPRTRWQHDAVAEWRHGTKTWRHLPHLLVTPEKEAALNGAAWQHATNPTSPSASESHLPWVHQLCMIWF